MFLKDFYLSPLLEAKKTIDCSCKITSKNKKAEVEHHEINVGQTNLFHWRCQSDAVTADSYPMHKQDYGSSSMGMLIPLSGPIISVADGNNIGGHASGVHLFSPKENLHQEWGKDAQALLLTVPLSGCTDLLSQLGMISYEEDISLATGISLPPETKPLVTNIINNLTYCYERRSLGLPFQEAWNKKIEELAAFFLLQNLHSSFSHHAGKYQTCLEDRNNTKSMTGLEKLEDYLLKHLAAPISLDDMTKASGLSRSYLHKLCLKHIGSSPMVWLRNLRLDAVDNHLKTKPGMNITDVALLYGFEHMGRFSGYFYKRFGYHPSSLKKIRCDF